MGTWYRLAPASEGSAGVFDKASLKWATQRWRSPEIVQGRVNRTGWQPEQHAVVLLPEIVA